MNNENEIRQPSTFISTFFFTRQRNAEWEKNDFRATMKCEECEKWREHRGNRNSMTIDNVRLIE